MKLNKLAEKLGLALHGRGDVEITGVAGMEHAKPSEVTFLANPKYAHKVKLSRAAAIIVSQPLADVPALGIALGWAAVAWTAWSCAASRRRMAVDHDVEPTIRRRMAG